MIRERETIIRIFYMEKIFSKLWSVRITVSLGIISLTVLFLFYFYIVFYLLTVFGSGLGF